MSIAGDISSLSWSGGNWKRTEESFESEKKESSLVGVFGWEGGGVGMPIPR